MSAYESARLDDYHQRRAAERDPLTDQEQRDFDALCAMAQTERSLRRNESYRVTERII